MKNKIDLLKKTKYQAVIALLCGAIVLGGCGKTNNDNDSNPSNVNYYVITYNDDNAIIFEMKDVHTGSNYVYDSGPSFEFHLNGPSVVIKNVDENSREFAYDIAQGLVGVGGTITFYNEENQMKLQK